MAGTQKKKSAKKNYSGKKGTSSKSASASKNKSNAKKSQTGKENNSSVDDVYEGLRITDVIFAIILLGIGAFLVAAVMTSAAGGAGEILSMILKGLFGIGAFVLPFYIIAYAILVIWKKMARISMRSIIFLVLTFVSLVTIYSLSTDYVTSETFGSEFISNVFESGTKLESAGVVGTAIGWVLIKFVGKAGLVIVSVSVFIISVLMVADTPISSLLDKNKEIKNQRALAKEEERAAKEEELRQRREMKAEEKRRQAEERKRQAEERAHQPEEEQKYYAEYPENDSRDGRGRSKRRGREAKEEYLDDDFSSLAEREAAKNNIPRYDSERGKRKGKEPFENIDFREYYRDESKSAGENRTKDETPNGGITSRRKDSLNGMDDMYNPYDMYDGTDVDYDGTDVSNAGFDYEMQDYAGSDSTCRDYAGGDSTCRDYAGRDDTGCEYTEHDAFRSEGGEICSESASSNISPENHMTRSQTDAMIAAGAAEVANQAQKTIKKKKDYRMPSMNLLDKPKKKETRNLRYALNTKAKRLEKVFADFNVNARVIDVKQGPSVTRYEIQPAPGVKVNSIVRLSNDIALNLEAKSLRMEAPIPGKAAIGIEVQNENRSVVTMREMLESDNFKNAESKLSFTVGMDISGNPVIADLAGMPHMLIAGSTGSGKSVCINSIIVSMLYKATPDEVRFIMIDPKVVELSNYNGIPHMLIPVITDPAKAAAALAWAVHEMNDRYDKFAENHARDLKSYNKKMKNLNQPENVMPQIVIIIDELADLMMVASNQVEESVCRLAQLARAAGMHLIVATQRPSVDIVTGLIKANIPSRIAFAVSSQVDSRTILDRAGAEKLVGKGDMLFHPLGKGQAERLQGPFVTDDEVNAVINFWKNQSEESSEPNLILESINNSNVDASMYEESEDELLPDAIDLVLDSGQASASMLQRRFRIGYNRAGRLIDIMEARGIIGPHDGSRPRRVLVSKEEYYGIDDDNSAAGEENAEEEYLKI